MDPFDTRVIVEYYEIKQEVYDLRDKNRDLEILLFEERTLTRQLAHVMYCAGLDPNRVVHSYDSLQLTQRKAPFHPPTRFVEMPWMVRKRFAFEGWQALVPLDMSGPELALAKKDKRVAGFACTPHPKRKSSLFHDHVSPPPPLPIPIPTSPVSPPA